MLTHTYPYHVPDVFNGEKAWARCWRWHSIDVVLLEVTGIVVLKPRTSTHTPSTRDSKRCRYVVTLPCTVWRRVLSCVVIPLGAGRSSEVERSLMVRWVVGSILHGVDPLSYFSFQPLLHDWCNKGRGMCYLVCGMVHIKEPLLLIDKSSLCGGSGFPFSLSEWSLTICLTPYNRR